MALTFRQLEIFEKIAATGSVTKAGEELLLTQSAVSMALSQLEQLSVTPLFERSGRRLLLNDSGRLLLTEARNIMMGVKRIELMLQGDSDQLVGELLIGGSTTIGNYLLPALLGTFARQYPKTRVELRVGNTQQVAEWLESGDLDIAFVEGPCHSRGLVAVNWRDDELVVVTAPDHLWARAKYATTEMLASAPWIMREKGSGTREVFENAMENAGASYAIALEFGHTEAIKNGVASGLGVSCLSRIAVHRELEYGLLVEVKNPLLLSRSLTLLKRRESCCTSLLAAFLKVSGGTWDKIP
ncbi:MAG: LysR substrate-binding domain-containing protein [Desulfuromonadaceae bacterium]|nr:LysR substrate-binding domain-containing protein [Desulfuromonadaceae bacterium]MDD2848762.1 LysR substrate-binding domain-containing protein [Desulfuromonadaceae bacterium]MDD4130412.1 LysR substrate-binding domain-containing protein [Desulfuromonadaceae bacterium]